MTADVSQHAAVAAALVLLERMGLSPADLAAVPRPGKPVPTFAEYVPVVSAAAAPSASRATASSKKAPTSQVRRIRGAEPSRTGASAAVAARGSSWASRRCGQRPAPPDEVGDASGEEAAGHPADCGAADVEAGCPRVDREVYLLAQVHHGDGWNAGQGQALAGAQDQQRRPGGGERAGGAQSRGNHERRINHPDASVAVGKRPGHDHADPEQHGRGRDRPGGP